MKKKVFRDTLRKSRGAAAAAVLAFVGAGVVFRLYGLPLGPFVYALLLVCFYLIILFAVTYARELSRAKEREQRLRAFLTGGELPPAYSLAEEDCMELIRTLRGELTRAQTEFENARQDEVDYYTAWVHQIKTPIAVMRMELGGGEADTRALETELFRIEQYVDMVLQYIRLGSASTDLVIRDYPLDSLIRETVRKFAPQFVAKRLRLCYEGTDAVVVTDKKWFQCLLEQLMSNAIKYTPSGSITVSLDGERLSVSDTGIGIAPEDVPRIFEKGFTGCNGRIEKRSSGLGLYLCAKAAGLLDIPLGVESTVGQGSSFSLDLSGKIKAVKIEKNT